MITGAQDASAIEITLVLQKTILNIITNFQIITNTSKYRITFSIIFLQSNTDLPASLKVRKTVQYNICTVYLIINYNFHNDSFDKSGKAKVGIVTVKAFVVGTYNSILLFYKIVTQSFFQCGGCRSCCFDPYCSICIGPCGPPCVSIDFVIFYILKNKLLLNNNIE